ncbi:transmembrane protein [Cystoisospora suis]|uniref:Transmembrane protein n=1 Tax=Cystoisospora suis TaxID=483139 RepID=A0A2C6KM77_9APIC|nr:transmembrane protein [Cystoisospora suis]
MQEDSELFDIVVWSSPAPVWLIVISSILFFCLSLFSFLLSRQKKTPPSFSKGLFFLTSPSLFANHYLSHSSSFSPASSTSYTSSLNTPLIISDSKKRRDRKTSSFSFFSSSHSKREEKRNERKRRRHERGVWNHAEERFSPGVEFSQDDFSFPCVYTGWKFQGDFVNERRRKLFVFHGEYARKKILLLITLASFLRAVLLLLQVFTPLEQEGASHPFAISLLSPEEFGTASFSSSPFPINERDSLVHPKKREGTGQSTDKEGYGEFHDSIVNAEEEKDIEKEEEEAYRDRHRFPPVSSLHVDTPPFLPPSWKEVLSLAERNHDRRWGVHTLGEGQGRERLSHNLTVTTNDEEDKKKKSVQTHAQEDGKVMEGEQRDEKKEEGDEDADMVQRGRKRKEKSEGRMKRDVRAWLVKKREKKEDDMEDVFAGELKTKRAEERRNTNSPSLSLSSSSFPHSLPYSSPQLSLSHSSSHSVHEASTSSLSPATPFPSSSSSLHPPFESLKKTPLHHPSPTASTTQIPSPPPSPVSTPLSHSSSPTSSSSSFSLFFPPHPLWLRTLVRSLPPLFSLTAYTLLVLFLLDLYFARMFAGKRVVYVSIISFFSLAAVWILFAVIALLTLEHHTQNQAHLFARSSALLLGTSFTLVSVAWAHIGSLLLQCLYTSHQQQQFPSLHDRLSRHLPPASHAHLLDHHRLNRPFYPPDPIVSRKKLEFPENGLNKRKTFLSFFFPQHPPSTPGDRDDELLGRNVFPRDKRDPSQKNAVLSPFYSSSPFHDILQPSPQQPPLFYRPRELHFQVRSSLSPSPRDVAEGMYSLKHREEEDLTHTDSYETRRRRKEEGGIPPCSPYTPTSLHPSYMKNPDIDETDDGDRNGKELHANSRQVLSASASHSLPYHLQPPLTSPCLPSNLYGTSLEQRRDHIYERKEEGEEMSSSFSRLEKENLHLDSQSNTYLNGERGWREDAMSSRPYVIHRDTQKDRETDCIDRKRDNGAENRFASREHKHYEKSSSYSRPSSSRLAPSRRDLPRLTQSSPYPPFSLHEKKRFSFIRSGKDRYEEQDLPNSFSSCISHTSQIDCENQTHLCQTAYRRVKFLSRCCPPLIAIRGIYLLLVGTQILPHYYPSKAHPLFLPFFFVSKHKETLDILLYLLTEFLPLSFVLISFARKGSKTRTKIRDEEEVEEDEEDGESEREEEEEDEASEWDGWPEEK